jgi:hypothetical protein
LTSSTSLSPPNNAANRSRVARLAGILFTWDAPLVVRFERRQTFKPEDASHLKFPASLGLHPWRESRVAGPFDYGITPNANGLFIGDYMGLITRGTEFLPFFAVANNGNAGNRSDVAFASITSPGTPVAGAVAVKSFEDDANAYRTETRGQMDLTPTLAAKFDAAIREAMQHRVPGWVSPALPAGAASRSAAPDAPR